LLYCWFAGTLNKQRSTVGTGTFEEEGLKLLQKGLCIAALLLCAAQASFANVISFSGNLTTDDDLATFQYIVQSLGTVNVYTTSFALGGFAPIISIFDPSGNFVNATDGAAANDCLNHATDPGTGACYDALVQWNSQAIGRYTVVLSQYGNPSEFQSTLTDGFTETNNTLNSPNYTGEPPYNPPASGSFLLPGPILRTSAYTIHFEADDSIGLQVQVVPEPATGLLLVGGVALFGWKKTRKKP
jgi:hypothetical protein